MKEPVEAIAQGKTPIDIAISKVDMRCTISGVVIRKEDIRCTICDASMDDCDCWTKCDCGWSFMKGAKCSNHDCGSNGE